MRRREFLKTIGQSALALGVLAASGRRWSLLAEDRIEALYKRAISVDAMCFTTNDYVPYLTEDRVKSLRTSGITAISLDVSLSNWFDLGMRNFYIVMETIARWNDFLDSLSDYFIKIHSAEDILKAKQNGKVGFIFNMQDTTPIAQNLHRVGLFYDLGIRQIQLSHNQRNFAVDSCWETANAGLSHFGRQLISALNQKRILIDIAHVGEKSSLEAISHSSAPLLASHTGCLALCPHPRNKSDQVIRALADKGGVICIYNMSGWMTQEPTASMAVFMKHLKHAINIAGEDHVGFGTDGDPAAMTPEKLKWEIQISQESFDEDVKEHPQLTWKIRHIRIKELNSPHRLLNLAKAMDQAGYKERTIEKIIGGNYFRLFKEVVG